VDGLLQTAAARFYLLKLQRLLLRLLFILLLLHGQYLPWPKKYTLKLLVLADQAVEVEAAQLLLSVAAVAAVVVHVA
jgi:hypothetical protein